MIWNPTSPDGTVSVKANTLPMQQNTTYTKDTLNVDHYWNESPSTLDGLHRKVHMTTEASDITLAGDATGGIFLKEATGGTIQGFYINAINTYQFIPSFLTGFVSLTSGSAYQTIVAVPDETYGLIYMFRTGTSDTGQSGFFKCSGGTCQTYGNLIEKAGSSTSVYNVKFGNVGEAIGLNIRGHRVGGSTQNYQYRVTYWDI